MQFALGWRAGRAEIAAVDEVSRTIGANRLDIGAHVDENVGMVKRRPRAGAHKFRDSHFDRRDAEIIVKVRD